MPSGRKSRATRRVASPPTSRARRASPKALVAGAVLVLAAALAIVLGVVLSGGKSSAPPVPAVGSLQNGLPGAADVNALFKGIPQRGMTLGSASAPVTLVEYVDLQCPYCKEVEVGVLPDILTRYVRSGKAKIVARPLAFSGDSVRGRNAMIAAGRQNRAFDFAEILYFNQGTENTGWLSEEMVSQAAASIPGLRVPDLLAALKGAGVSKLAAQYDAVSHAGHVNATPTFVVQNGIGDQVTLVAPSAAALRAAIDAALP
jgi:protein-disulfide isomerase